MYSWLDKSILSNTACANTEYTKDWSRLTEHELIDFIIITSQYFIDKTDSASINKQ